MATYNTFRNGMVGAFAGALLLTAGCSEPLSTREKGTLIGGVGGAGAGALIGSAVGSPGAGAAIGGALGAGGGALVGDQLQGQERDQQRLENELSAQDREIRRQRQELERLEDNHESGY
ncbi:MAG: glycine zipper domain-containing protein [Candidatus Binatia bacterium]